MPFAVIDNGSRFQNAFHFDQRGERKPMFQYDFVNIRPAD